MGIKRNLIIYVSYIFFINLNYLYNLVLLFKASFNLNTSLPDGFILKLLAQQSLISLFIVFLFLIISRLNIDIYIKATLFIFFYMVTAIALSIFMYVYVFANIERFDIKSFISRNIFIWLYIYLISWVYFGIVNYHKKNKRGHRI